MPRLPHCSHWYSPLLLPLLAALLLFHRTTAKRTAPLAVLLPPLLPFPRLVGLCLPQILLLSRLTAVALLIVYTAYLIFQLGTHHDMFTSGQADESPAQLTLTTAGLWLAGITVLVAFMSEFLTGSIEEVSESLPGSFGEVEGGCSAAW